MSSLIFNDQYMLMTALKVDICQDWKSTIESGLCEILYEPEA